MEYTCGHAYHLRIAKSDQYWMCRVDEWNMRILHNSWIESISSEWVREYKSCELCGFAANLSMHRKGVRWRLVVCKPTATKLDTSTYVCSMYMYIVHVWDSQRTRREWCMHTCFSVQAWFMRRSIYSLIHLFIVIIYIRHIVPRTRNATEYQSRAQVRERRTSDKIFLSRRRAPPTLSVYQSQNNFHSEG